MIESDTIKLLRECDAGIKMGIVSIAEILDDVKDGQLEKMLVICKEGHEKLQKEIQMLLEKYHDTGKMYHALFFRVNFFATDRLYQQKYKSAAV